MLESRGILKPQNVASLKSDFACPSHQRFAFGGQRTVRPAKSFNGIGLIACSLFTKFLLRGLRFYFAGYEKPRFSDEFKPSLKGKEMYGNLILHQLMLKIT